MNRTPILFLNVLVIATCGLIYELQAATLSSFILGDSVTQFSLVIGLYLSALGVGAWLVHRMRAVEDGRMMMRMALDLLIILVPLQFFLGDQHGLNTLRYQPAKLAAIEGRYDTAGPAPLTLFGIPDDRNARMRFAVDVPQLGSLILTHSRDGVIKGLKEWPASDWPPA